MKTAKPRKSKTSDLPSIEKIYRELMEDLHRLRKTQIKLVTA